MSVAWCPEEIVGDTALLLVAPHGGRRDWQQVPWGARPLKMNDLFTACLTRELAARTGASALINPDLDRNLVDLNRISAVAAHAPAFLDALARALDRLLAAHDRVTVLFLHGWNVGHASIDLGIGVRPGQADDLPAVEVAFQTHTLPALVHAAAADGICVSVGQRYPARAKENLVQLFTGRHASDPRPIVASLAQHAARVDALQVELGLPLRLPGPRRTAWLEAWQRALTHTVPAAVTGASSARGVDGPPIALQFTSPTLSGIVRRTRDGALLLFVLSDGRLVTFTGERVVGHEALGGVGGVCTRTVDEGIAVYYEGPAVRFPDTRPFEDLERGLAHAQPIELAVALVYRPSTAGFGRVTGAITIAGTPYALDAGGFVLVLPPEPAHVAVALRLNDQTQVWARRAVGTDRVDGMWWRDGTQHRVVTLDPRHIDDRLNLIVGLDDSTAHALALTLCDQIPVVRNHPPPNLRTTYALCRALDAATPAGWVELTNL